MGSALPYLVGSTDDEALGRLEYGGEQAVQAGDVDVTVVKRSRSADAILGSVLELREKTGETFASLGRAQDTEEDDHDRGVVLAEPLLGIREHRCRQCPHLRMKPRRSWP